MAKQKHPQRDAFLKELIALMDKYKASFGFSVGKGSDTYGLHGERMTIDLQEEVRPGHTYANHIEVASIDGWSMNARDIRKEL